jgi:uncharacterized protein
VKTPTSTPVTLWALLFCALTLSACLAGPRPATLYTLHPIEHDRQQDIPVVLKEMIMVMPVRLAPQLQGRGLVIQRSPTASVALSNHLWAGPLDQQVTNVITTNLKELLVTDNVVVYPGPRFSTPRYQVEVELNDFSGDEHFFNVRAVATISDTSMKTILSRKTFRQTRAIDKPDYSDYVGAASLAIADLSREVATALLDGHQSRLTGENDAD